MMRYVKLAGKIIMYGFVWPFLIVLGLIGVVSTIVFEH